jgi:hypothetical protein
MHWHFLLTHTGCGRSQEAVGGGELHNLLKVTPTGRSNCDATTNTTLVKVETGLTYQFTKVYQDADLAVGRRDRRYRPSPVRVGFPGTPAFAAAWLLAVAPP